MKTVQDDQVHEHVLSIQSDIDRVLPEGYESEYCALLDPQGYGTTGLLAFVRIYVVAGCAGSSPAKVAVTGYSRTDSGNGRT